jgi:hypothetical protein
VWHDEQTGRSAAVEKIGHAYGPASDVPGHLRTIARAKTAEALTALGELANNLNHQGSIYPVTGPAVSFVIEVLRTTQAGPRVRAGLLRLLTGMRRAVVEACYANAAVWDQSIGNTDLAFMRVGLPASRAGLGKLLGKK